MIIDIKGYNHSGKTSNAIQLMDSTKKTFVYSQDGDFASVYQLVTGNDIHAVYGDKLTMFIGNLASDVVNEWFAKVDTTLFQKFFDSDSEFLIIDGFLPATFIEQLRYKMRSEPYQNRTMIVVGTIINHFEFDPNKALVGEEGNHYE